METHALDSVKYPSISSIKTGTQNKITTSDSIDIEIIKVIKTI